VTYATKLSFVITGLDYASLASDSTAVASLTTMIAQGVCGSISRPTIDCEVTLSAGSVSVEVVIAQSSLLAADAAASHLTANAGAITDALLLNVIGDADIMAHGTGGTLTVQDVQVTTEVDGGSAIGDPHLESLAGKKFDVNMPGSYVLIRAPQDRRKPAKLELNASLEPCADGPCGLYIQSLRLGGQWLGDQVVGVVPLRRNVVGHNGAGNITLRPFSVWVQAHQGDHHAEPGEYEQWGDLRKGGRSLSGRVRLEPVWRQVYADAGRTQEAQAFQFRIRGAGAGYDATFEAAQAAHQALDFRATGLRSLGFEQLGGLLGTEEHDKRVERVADACKIARMKNKITRVRKLVAGPDGRGLVEDFGSSMSADWMAKITRVRKPSADAGGLAEEQGVSSMAASWDG
jgi:hypothetical protein